MSPLLVDHMLQRLSRWLRAAGFDAAWQAEPQPFARVAERAHQEGRVLVTQTRTGSDVPGVVTVPATSLEDQVVAVMSVLGLPEPRLRFSRCMICNLPVVSVPLEKARLPPSVRARCSTVRTCPGCDRLFWDGDHTASMCAVLDRVEARVRGGAPPPAPSRPAAERAREQAQFDAFLKTLFAAHGFSWVGFRKKRRTIRPRLRQRMAELGLSSYDAYLAHLGAHPEEQARLHPMLAITVSRFFREREAWFRLDERLDALARQGPVRAWSLGCACGEEPYTLRLLTLARSEASRPPVPMTILATDISPVCLSRAQKGRFETSAVHSIPEAIRRRWFQPHPDGGVQIDPAVPGTVTFRQHDLLADPWPAGPFDLILCRNLVFTYLDGPRRSAVATRLAAHLRPGGLLMVGSNDRMGDLEWPLVRLEGHLWTRPIDPSGGQGR